MTSTSIMSDYALSSIEAIRAGHVATLRMRCEHLSEAGCEVVSFEEQAVVCI
jgi:hypothetical protein